MPGPWDAWAVGDDAGGNIPVALHWNGTEWKRALLPDPAPDSADRLRAVSASGPNDVWAVGYTITGFEGVISPLIEHFNGRRWSKVDSFVPDDEAQLRGIVSIGPNDVWAVGSGPGIGIMEHWDGHLWEPRAKGLGFRQGLTSLTSLAALGGDDVWTAGAKVVPARGPSDKSATLRTVAYHWDGIRWNSVTPLNTAQANNTLMSIDVASPTDIWAVGGSYGPNRYIADHTLAEHYDGQAWRIVDTPDVGADVSLLNDVSIGPNGDAWAVGQSSSNGQRTSQTLALHWNGKRWHNQSIRPRH